VAQWQSLRAQSGGRPLTTRTPGLDVLAATCTGAFLVVTADFASQRLHASAQLPVGVVAAVVGGVHLG
jgi:iron complex transport system permease protein